jgi:omega-6 fatty acid desaturase (delta-12 desaturase)
MRQLNVHASGISDPESLQLALLRPYQAPVTAISAWQIISTFGLFVGCMAAAYASARLSVWLTLALALPMSGLMVRIFVLQHDFGHNAMFRSRRLNVAAGRLCSLVTLTPFAYFRRTHALHHGNWNNLDGRGNAADFHTDCATVAEFAAMTPRQKLLYRVIHHPLISNILLPPLVFVLLFRLPLETPASCRHERYSVYLLDLVLIGIFGGLVAAFGVKTVMLVQLPAVTIAAIVGVWLISVQHRFPGAEWLHKPDWSAARAALHGTSYLRLHPVLQWFTAGINLHHVHHLNPGIPNYRLQACHDACGVVTDAATVLTLKQVFAASRHVLWDEDAQRMVPLPR